MINVVTFEPQHIDQIQEQKAMAYLGAYITDEHKKFIATSPYSYSAVSDSGEIIGCLGVLENWPGRCTCWAILSQDCKNEMVSLHKAVRRFLKVCPYKRIEASVQYDFKPGHRWAKALGFTLEAERMRSYLPGGADASLYAMVRG